MKRLSALLVLSCIGAFCTSGHAQRSAKAVPSETDPGPLVNRSEPPAWSSTDKFYSTGGVELDRFGSCAAVDGDLAVVGAPFASQTPYFAAGKAYLFQLETSGEWTQILELQAANPNQFGDFGAAVDIRDGVIAVGTPSDDPACPGLLNCTSGSVTMYEQDATGSWNRGSELFPSDTAKFDRFGHSVSLFGDWLAVGAWGEGNNGPVVGVGNGHGAVYLYRRVAPGTWVEEQKLVPDTLQASDRFGAAVSLDGSTLIVGAPGDLGSSTLGSVGVDPS